MTEPTTEPGRALLGLDMAPESGYWVSLGAYEMRNAILAIEAAAAEAERARIRAVREAAQMAMEVLMRLQLHDLPEHRGDVDAAYEGLRAALAAIDAPGTAPAEPRCDFDCDACRSTPDTADEWAPTPDRADPLEQAREWLRDPDWPQFGPGIGFGPLDMGRIAARAAVQQILDLATPDRADPSPCLFVPPHEPFYCRIHADVRLRLTDERCRTGERLATPDRAAIDDEAKTPQWRDDSGHWIGGNVGMPEPAIDDEAKG